jgi:hypothetical protein
MPGTSFVVCGNIDTKVIGTSFICSVWGGNYVTHLSADTQAHKDFTQVQATWRLTAYVLFFILLNG